MRVISAARQAQPSCLELLYPSALGALGVPGAANPLGLPAAERIWVLLIDGLGYHQLARSAAQAPFLHSLLRTTTPGRSPLPSTTAVSLVSLGTGLPPGRHGVVGYTFPVTDDQRSGDGRMFCALDWPVSVPVPAVQPHATVFEQAPSLGVATTVCGKRAHARTPLTRAALQSPGRLLCDSVGERVAAIQHAGSGDGPFLGYLYEGDLDQTGHAHGVDSDAWRYQLEAIDRMVEHMADVMPRDTALVITADHGMFDVDRRMSIELADHPRLMAGVVAVGGDARMRYLWTAGGEETATAVAARWREAMDGIAVVLTRSEAIARGWFGAVDAAVADRLGDVIVARTDEGLLLYRSAFPGEYGLVGMHGSITEAEVDVPLLVVSA